MVSLSSLLGVSIRIELYDSECRLSSIDDDNQLHSAVACMLAGASLPFWSVLVSLHF